MGFKIHKAVSLLYFIYILSVSSEKHSLETQFLEVPIDHFGLKEQPTNFNIRYLMDSQYYADDADGPIFVYLGHEADVNIFARNTDFLYNIAPQFKALIVYIEHRYYGESMPFGNDSFSTANMRYLSTPQVLGDFAHVISHLKYKQFKNNPIIVFGGGYGGNLAAWFRFKYPFLAKGAISSSAPLIYSTEDSNCGKFYEKVTKVFEEYGQRSCIRSIKLVWDVLINVSKTKLGKDFLSSSFKLCAPIKEEEDVQKLIDWISNVYVELATYNYHYPTNYFRPMPAYPVKIFCDKLTTSSVNDSRELLEDFADALSIYTNYSMKTVCNNLNDSLDDAAKFSYNYQACTELIRSKCSTESDMFIDRAWNIEHFNLECFRNFGIKTSMDMPTINYGSYNLKDFSNVVFTNGLNDPWSVYGIVDNISSTVAVYNIKEGPHHVDLRGFDSADNNYVTDVRKYHVDAINKWLYE